MNTSLRLPLILIAIAALANPSMRAQTAPAAPAAAVQSPEVGSDNRVTFRLNAPNAKEVVMQPEPGARVSMVKGEDGIWSVTVGPWAPDVYAYRFVVDGINTPDPSNGAPLKTSRPNVAGEIGMLGGWQSEVVVPNREKPEAWEVTAIPHGITSHVEFWSPVMGAFRDYFVYTPPGYNARRAEPYPVLYLLHGAGENASGWINTGKAHLIMDSLIAEGRAVPMIVVMPLGHTSQEPRPGFAVQGEKAEANAADATPGNTPFFSSLIDEIMPQVERAFNAGTTKSLRAIAGLSMGGGQTLSLSLAYPEKFSYVGMFSSAIRGGRGGGNDQNTYTLPEGATTEWGRQFKLFWIACGRDDRLFAANTAFKAALAERDIPFEDIVTDGGHSFTVWKRNLVEFAPNLFR